ncbi:MAG: Holliday junction branch migration protein RuvA [Anaerorhabdus sp.]
MIAFLKGIVSIIGYDWIVIDVNGVGYKVAFFDASKVIINQEIMVFTYHHIREEEMSLYGFLQEKDHDLFLKLISVKGVGPKTAMNFFGKFNSDKIIDSIENSDVAFLKSLPGIGAKTASQIILDLQNKLVNDNLIKLVNEEIEDALSCLKSLGYKSKEINVVKDYLITLDKTSSDEYLKFGLKYLMKLKGGDN